MKALGMRDTRRGLLVLAARIAVAQMTAPAAAQPKPNILVIMGDDIGIWNIGAYHRGMMAGRLRGRPNTAARAAARASRRRVGAVGPAV